MKISFVGAGKVGTAFAAYIKAHHDVLYFKSQSIVSAKKAAAYVGCSFTDNLKELVIASDLICITTPDNQIKSVVNEIASLHLDLKHKYFIHMSGAMTSEIFENIRPQGAIYASIHPLQSFAIIGKAVEDLKQTYLAYESNTDDLLEFLTSLGNPYFRLKADQKTKYHLSACVFSNYLVTLMDFGNRMLKEIGIEEEGLTAMLPLIEATFENIKIKGTKEALTGPIQRSDTNTITKHLSELEGIDLRTYKTLGEMTTEYIIDDEDQKRKLNKLWRLS